MNHWPPSHFLLHPAFEKWCNSHFGAGLVPADGCDGSRFLWALSPSTQPLADPYLLIPALHPECGQKVSTAASATHTRNGEVSPVLPAALCVSTKQGQLGVSAFSASLVSFFYPNSSSFSSAGSVALYKERHVYPVMGTKPDKRHSTHKLSQSLTSCPSMADSGQANNKKELLNACIRPVKCEFGLDCSTLNAQCLLLSGGRNMGIQRMYQWPEDSSSPWFPPAWPAEKKNPAVSALLTGDSEQKKPFDSKDWILVAFLCTTTR